MRFRASCSINGKTFDGFGPSKKLAKLAAAKVALGELEINSVVAAKELPPNTLPQLLADHVARLVNLKFAELMSDDTEHSRRKVLAGIVLTINNQMESAKVIAVTTGTKCVSGEHLSFTGLVLNDCHAEVTARRCLQRFLYSQLLVYATSSDPTKVIPDLDLEPIPSGGYQLKPNRQVHLYVSTAPCGDGRLFYPNDNIKVEPDKHPNRLARGLLRTKIECGEGTIPVKNSCISVQTWDGVIEGERLLTMSCSDKVARWCVVGLQGALLGCFIKPVYLHSLVLGSLLHPQHMYRAVCGRIKDHLSALPPSYQQQAPLLGRATSAEVRTPGKAPKFAVCWSCCNRVPEIVNSSTGKLENGTSSLLCKQAMYVRWQCVAKALRLLPQETEPGVPTDISYLSYDGAKHLCKSYKAADKCLKDAFKRAGLGQWIKKPIEQDHFICDAAGTNVNALF